jgi:aminotransferase
MVDEYARRRTLLVDGLSQIEAARLHVPEGTFFAFVDLQAFGLDSLALAMHLLNQGHVVSSPGHAYGTLGQGHIRLSFAAGAEAIKEGLERIKVALDYLRRQQ